MGAARKIWDDAKAKIPEKNWDAKLKIADFGPRLDEIDKHMVACFQKIRLLEADIAKYRSLRSEVGTMGKSSRRKIKDCGTVLQPDQKKNLVEGNKEAM